jgi:hypothetical protein
MPEITIIDNGVSQGERCTSLRCKGMYTNWGQPAGEKVPDDNLVGDGECRHAGRSCYES